MTNKAYDPAWAHHEAVRADARHWHRAGLLPEAQLQAIRAAYPLDFYRPNIYLRILLFVVTVVAAFLGVGLGALVLFIPIANSIQGENESIFFGICALLCAGAGFFILEAVIRTSRHYRAGPDLALLYLALGWASTAWFAFMRLLPLEDSSTSFLTFSYLPLFLLPVLALLLLAVVRYGDALVTAAAYGVVLALLANTLLRFGIGRLVLPFAVMLLAVGLYQVGQRLARRVDYLYYQYCFVTLKALALSTFYLGGNYLVVREANAAISGASVSTQIPLAWLFYGFTAVIPLAYLYQGLRRPDRVWLLTGLAALGFSGYTVRYYHSVLPPAVASALLGALLVGLMAAALRYLRPARHGLTAAADAADPRPGLNLESLIVAQTAPAPTAPAPGFEFGGGHSGGGGADGRF